MKPKEDVAYTGRVKYDQKRATKYQDRKAGKHNAEMRLIDKAFSHVPKSHRILVVPCGGGRVSVHLASQGYDLNAGDLSDSMIAIATENYKKNGLKGTVRKLDVEKFDLPDRAFDTVVSFRLFHHFPTPEIRERVAGELCRIAKHSVVLSYFSPLSVTSAKNRLLAMVGGKKEKKFSTSLTEIENYFRAHGFKLVKDYAQTPILHTLHVAVFERSGSKAK